MTQKSDNPFVNLIINIILPTLILTKLSGEQFLGPTAGLCIALIIPFSYGVYSLIKERKINWFSIIGLISISLTGILGLLSLDAKWIILKEAGIPTVLGLIVLLSIKTPFSIVKKILINNQIFNMEIINSKLTEKNNTELFVKKHRVAGLLLACSFFISGILNYYLATNILVSSPGTETFNEELGLMTAYSFPVIAIPSMLILFLIFMYIVSSIKKLTGLDFDGMVAEKLK